jgi:hypothetical protein
VLAEDHTSHLRFASLCQWGASSYSVSGWKQREIVADVIGDEPVTASLTAP